MLILYNTLIIYYNIILILYNTLIIYYNIMGPPSYMRSVVDLNVVMLLVPVFICTTTTTTTKTTQWDA